MDVFELAARIVLDKTMFDKGLKDAENRASKAGNNISKGLSKIGSTAKTALKIGATSFAAIGTVAAGAATAIVKVSGQVAEYGDNIDKMSQKMGISAQGYQEWNEVMKHSGTSMEALRGGMKTLSNAVEKGSDAFERLGISQEEIASMDKEELFNATIAALQNVEDESERTYLAGKLLGRGATELGALLNMSAEETQALKDRTHELGGVMSDEAVKAAAAYQDSLQDMQFAFGGVQRGIVGEFLPSITTVMDGLTEIFSGNSGSGITLINDGINKFVDKMLEVIPRVLEVGSSIIGALGDAIMENLPKIIELGASVIVNIATGLINALPEFIVTAVPAFISTIGQIIAQIVDMLPVLLDSIVTAVGSVVDSISDYLNEKSPILGAAFDALVGLGRTAFDTLGNLWNGEGGLKEKWEEINVWVSETLGPAVSEAWTGIKDTIGGIFTGIMEYWNGEGGLQGVWNGIVDFINNTLKPNFDEQFNAVKDIVSTAFTSIKNIWTNDLSPALQALWETFKDNIMPVLNDVAIKFSNFRTNVLKKLADFITGPVSEAWSTLTGFFNDVLVPIIETVSSYFLVLYEEVISPLYNFMIENFDKVWKQFTDWWKETGAPKMYELKQAFKTFKENYLEPLSAKIVIFKSIMNTLWENVLKPVATWITDTFQVAIEGLEGAFSGLIDFLTGIFTGDWEKAWDGIKEIFGSVWNTIADLAKGPINSVIGFINSLIDAVESALNAIIGGFNRIHVTIPRWVPKFGGSSFGISIPYVDFGRIDYLAKGGHLLRGDAIVGEKGPELLHRENGQTTVIPLSGGERDIDGLMGGNTYNFNIYPSPAQSPLEIAQEVQRIFVEWEHQKEVAYA